MTEYSKMGFLALSLFILTLHASSAEAAVPTITDVIPPMADAGSEGFYLSVYGTNFTADSIVRVNGADRATIGPFASNELRAEITTEELASPGTLNITVFNPGDDGGTSNVIEFNVIGTLPRPTITSIDPTYALLGSGPLIVTINGTGFTDRSVVRVNVPGQLTMELPTTYISPTQLRTTIPASAFTLLGFIVVFVNTPIAGSSSGETITIVDPTDPSIIAINPNQKEQGSAGFTLTVSGRNFLPNSVVTFEGTGRTTTFVSSTTLTAQIPASDLTTYGIFIIRVETPLPPDRVISGGVTFTVTVRPTITSIHPSSVNAGSGETTLMVSGNNFISGSLVQVEGTDDSGEPFTFLVPTVFLSATRLDAVLVGIQEAGEYDIKVNNPGGVTSNSVTFTIVATAPTISSVVPESATTGDPDTTITVTGTNFKTDSFVNAFNSRGYFSVFSTTYVSENELRAIIPAASLAASETYDIAVTNPNPPETSNAVRFTVSGDAPEPIPLPRKDYGNLVITKYTVGGNGAFSFISTIPDHASFVLNTDFIGSRGQAASTFSNIPPGGYIISESVPIGWTKTADTCAFVGIRQGETTRCSVTNTRNGTRIGSSGTRALDEVLLQFDVELVEIQKEITDLQEFLRVEVETPAALSSSQILQGAVKKIRGVDTKMLQMFLNVHGFTVAAAGPGSRGNETTFFGNLTKQALCKFQVENDIVRSDKDLACGIYGPKTRQKIVAMGR